MKLTFTFEALAESLAANAASEAQRLRAEMTALSIKRQYQQGLISQTQVLDLVLTVAAILIAPPGSFAKTRFSGFGEADESELELELISSAPNPASTTH